MNVFLDTEFTDFLDPQIISLGMASEYGDDFYAEVPYPDHVRFPRYLVCHQVSFMQRVFPDFAYSSSDRDIELAIDIRVLNAGGFDYKRLRYIRSWQPSFQHG